MSETKFRHTAITTAIMVLFTIVGTALLVFTYFTTKSPIEASEAEARLMLLEEVLPKSLHDNNLLLDAIEMEAGGLLGNAAKTLAYRGRLGGKAQGVVLEATAPDGYSGDIKLLIAIRIDGSLAGVRVLAHKETPGLGDYIEIGHGDWIKHFDNQSLVKTVDGKTPEEYWKVKKDGGNFDYMAGATITPRAIVKAVHKALQYYQTHQATLFAEAGGQK